jgi:hypothetical protein
MAAGVQAREKHFVVEDGQVGWMKPGRIGSLDARDLMRTGSSPIRRPKPIDARWIVSTPPQHCARPVPTRATG